MREGRVEVVAAGEDKHGRVGISEEGRLGMVVVVVDAKKHGVVFEAGDLLIAERASGELVIKRSGDRIALGYGGELPIAVDIDQRDMLEALRALMQVVGSLAAEHIGTGVEQGEYIEIAGTGAVNQFVQGEGAFLQADHRVGGGMFGEPTGGLDAAVFAGVDVREGLDRRR